VVLFLDKLYVMHRLASVFFLVLETSERELQTIAQIVQPTVTEMELVEHVHPRDILVVL